LGRKRNEKASRTNRKTNRDIEKMVNDKKLKEQCKERIDKSRRNLKQIRKSINKLRTLR
jgi:hypothetical protein